MNSLYHSHLLSHYHSPKNYGLKENFDREARGENRMCGDSLIVRIREEGEKIADICFEGEGCVVSRASASILYDYLKGKTKTDIKNLKPDDVLQIIQAPITSGRIKCALLPLETLHKAL